MTHGRRNRAAAAAAVFCVLVVGGCGTATDEAEAPARAVLADGAASPSPTASSPTTSPAIDPDTGPDIEPDLPPGQSPAASPLGGQPWDATVSAACAETLESQAGSADLEQVAQTAHDGGVTSFWERGTRWVVCDALTGADAPPPVLIASHRRARLGFDGRALALASTAVTGPDGEVSAVRYVAAGRLPWPVQEITYTFPDGHTERARFVRSENGPDTWWAVSYTAEDGILVDPDTDPADLEPLVVSVVGGAAEAFRLPWDQARTPTEGQRSE
ncbi:MAG TPA: hypothetical protein VFG63_06605 [Nocardioidaceae bacterium]|nr:hypothetical protein [Nocardioidaceae bacterium]